ncbi:DNA glycosylase, partial [Lineolata rhizophorae]
SCIPCPPLDSPSFGLIQEKFADNPFHLLLVVYFLNKTKGTAAIPSFFSLIERYPTAEDLAHASEADITEMIKPLGLQNIRSRNIVIFAKKWVSDPPQAGKRYRTLNYPRVGDGRDIKRDEIVADNAEDPREGAFEIGHLPICGPYARDSWRIFCRDVQRGIADGWNGEGRSGMFEPEWKRVVPSDKELRAFLRWMWLREGWDWDPLTGEKKVASSEVLDKAKQGDAEWVDPDEGTSKQQGDKNAALALAREDRAPCETIGEARDSRAARLRPNSTKKIVVVEIDAPPR